MLFYIHRALVLLEHVILDLKFISLFLGLGVMCLQQHFGLQ